MTVGGRGCSTRRLGHRALGIGHWELWQYDLPHAQKLRSLGGVFR